MPLVGGERRIDRDEGCCMVTYKYYVLTDRQLPDIGIDIKREIIAVKDQIRKLHNKWTIKGIIPSVDNTHLGHITPYIYGYKEKEA